MVSQQSDYLFKILLLGSDQTGKSMMVQRFVDDQFSESYISTIGIDFKIKTMNVLGKQCKVSLWDSAGQQRFRALTKSYLRGSAGVLIVFDITRQPSFDEVPSFLQDIQSNTSQSTKVFLVGNKLDLSTKRVIQYEEALKFCQQNKIQYFEVSAKTGENIQQSFDLIVQALIYQIQGQGEVKQRDPEQVTEEVKEEKVESIYKDMY